mgnify:CR=1 FL=1
MSASKWIRKVEENIKEIRELNPSDRLEIVSAIAKCNNAITASVGGWATWLSSPTLMNELSEDELKAILEEFKEIAIQFLENDIKWTKLMNGRLKAKKKERPIIYRT